MRRRARSVPSGANAAISILLPPRSMPRRTAGGAEEDEGMVEDKDPVAPRRRGVDEPGTAESG